MTRFLLRTVALVATVAAATAAPALAAPRSTAATPSPYRGVVNIDTTLGYEQSQAAGTGIVVTSSGQVITNNHVIRGATKITVVVPQTGRRYDAKVVGYSVSADVAVLQLVGASNLTTAQLGISSSLKIGQPVRAVGNAGGRGGTPSIAVGKIIALNRTIVATSADNGARETLRNLIATSAPVQPGDSGGPLLNKAGRVIGVVTAGSSGFTFQASAERGFAIPINKVRTLAKRIVAGQSSSTIHVGPTAFLGVSIDPRVPGGAAVAAVLPGTAAERAGLQAGDLITSLNGVSLNSASDLQDVVLTLEPDKPVSIAWQDSYGQSSSGTITPASGPPQ